jgi:hypothetical protein
MKLSVILPVYYEIYLQETVNSLLENSKLGNQLELIVVYDGYWPDKLLKDDPHIKIVHLGRNRGMRGAINAGVAVSTGEFIMRVDTHCMFGEGYDKIMTDTCPPDAIMTAVRFFLDPVKWEVMNLPPVYYEKLVIQEGKKFAGQRWDSRTEERKNIMIDETMAMQGSVWLMPRAWWDKVIVELQTEGYGPLIQDSHEMIFKTWKAGGKMLLNKLTWFAHKHRSFPRTHNNGSPENPANCDAGYAYALSVWRDYYEKEIRPKWGI